MARFAGFGNTIHPSETAVRKKRLGVTSLLPCIQCGAHNDANTTAWARQGEGLVRTVDSNGVDDSMVGSGCWHCGSLYWRKTKPPKFRDDRYLADPDRRKVRR